MIALAPEATASGRVGAACACGAAPTRPVRIRLPGWRAAETRDLCARHEAEAREEGLVVEGGGLVKLITGPTRAPAVEVAMAKPALCLVSTCTEPRADGGRLCADCQAEAERQKLPLRGTGTLPTRVGQRLEAAVANRLRARVEALVREAAELDRVRAAEPVRATTTAPRVYLCRPRLGGLPPRYIVAATPEAAWAACEQWAGSALSGRQEEVSVEAALAALQPATVEAWREADAQAHRYHKMVAEMRSALDEAGAPSMVLPTGDATPAARVRAWVAELHRELDKGGAPNVLDSDVDARIRAWVAEMKQAAPDATAAALASLRGAVDEALGDWGFCELADDNAPAARIAAHMITVHGLLDDVGCPEHDANGDHGLLERIQAWAEELERERLRARQDGEQHLTGLLAGRLRQSAAMRLAAAGVLAPDLSTLRRAVQDPDTSVFLARDLLQTWPTEDDIRPFGPEDISF